MDFLTFTTLGGGTLAFFAQDVATCEAVEYVETTGRIWVTHIEFRNGKTKVVRESYAVVMEKLATAWGGEVK